MKLTYLLFGATMLVFTSCSTFKHSSRVSSIPENALGQADKIVVDVEVDLGKQVKARSQKHSSVKDAKDEAYFRAVVDNNCHVVVDPIYSIKTTKTLFGSKSMAEIIGFAGYYKNARPEAAAEQVAYDRALENTKKMMDLGIDTSDVNAYTDLKDNSDSTVDDAGAGSGNDSDSGFAGKAGGLLKGLLKK